MEMERKQPTRGDPSWRRLRSDATSDTVEAHHLHIDTGYIERDLNVALPLDRVRELVAEGVVGAHRRSPLRCKAKRWISRCSRRSDPTAAGPSDWSRAISRPPGFPPSPST
jgi:hypothetical protein